jgi:hypothetical protein
MNASDFPLWLFVNEMIHPKEGFPYHVLRLGGPPTRLPTTLPVFKTERSAENLQAKRPFMAVPVDQETFCEVLKACRDVDDVVLELGNPTAVHYQRSARWLEARLF